MMNCKFCRKQIDDDSNFCKYCGMPVAINTKLENKEFIFKDFSRNRANLADINDWLATKNIHIEKVNVDTVLNKAVIDSQLIIKRASIDYNRVNTDSHYRMGCYTSYTWNPRDRKDFTKLDQKLNAWQSNNPDEEITWKTYIETEDDAANCVYQALIFIHIGSS